MALEDYRGDMEMCCRCSCCKFIPMQMVQGAEYSYACPSIAKYNFHAYSAGGRLNIAASMLKKGFNYSDKILDIVKNCQMCGACGVSCNYAMDMEVLEPIQEFRIKTVEDGHTVPALEKVITSLGNQGSMVPVTGKRGDWASGLNLKDATSKKVNVLYHVGCLTSYDKNMQKLAKATVNILQKAGVNFGITGDAEMCCGGRAYQMGYKEDFLNQAKKNMAMIKKAGIKTLVASCSNCYQAFKVLYDKYNLRGDLEVLHITEYIARSLNEETLKPSKKVALTVTYHDPCRLGRLGEPWIHWEGKKIPGDRFVFDPPKIYRRGTHGVYEPPREVLNSISGIKLMEMTRIKEYAWCCGAGGGVNESNPEFAMWTANERIREAVSTGAEAIVTACPWCEKTFNEAIQKNESSLKVYDIVELVEKAI
ncbi:MAG: (Fe-S)-binding protein [Chloroflexi bacterium]|nr:(Fe-S)-binding protein [Chloroflexota bacterium]